MARKILQSNEDQINLLAINAGGSTTPYTGVSPVYIENQLIGLDTTATDAINQVSNKLSKDIWNSTTGSFALTSQIEDINYEIGIINTDVSSLTDQVSENTQTISDHTSNITQLTNDINDIQNSLSSIDEIKNDIDELKYDIDTISSNLDDKLNIDDINVENNKITSINIYGESIPIGGSNLTAGTDLVINNGVISVNTDGTIGNSADMSFVAGSGTSADGIGAVAGGAYSYASGKAAFAIGTSASAIGRGAFAAGTLFHPAATVLLGALASGEGAIAIGIGNSAIADGAYAEGEGTIASGIDSHAEGYWTKAYKKYAHAEGAKTHAVDFESHAEGNCTTAYGQGSHAEGQYTNATGNCSHAEGSATSAVGSASHAEGMETSAIGNYSHAEGEHTIASGDYSHAGGYYTTAKDPCMTVIGRYNNTTENAVFVIGNGTLSPNGRKDAFIVDWDGNISGSNSIILNQSTTGGGEYKGISFKTSTTNADMLWDNDGSLLYVKNHAPNQTTTPDTSHKIFYSNASAINSDFSFIMTQGTRGECFQLKPIEYTVTQSGPANFNPRTMEHFNQSNNAAFKVNFSEMLNNIPYKFYGWVVVNNDLNNNVTVYCTKGNSFPLGQGITFRADSTAHNVPVMLSKIDNFKLLFACGY